MILLKITRITTQKKNKHRYNIYVAHGDEQDAYAFSVDEDVLIQFDLRKGFELTEQMLNEITAKDEVQKLYLKVVHYLSYRMRTEKELVTYLLKQEAEENAIAEIMDKLTKQKLIDDLAFAKMFVRNRMNTSSKGPAFIRNELRQKGIKPAYIDEAIALFAKEVQLEKAQKMVGKKLRPDGRQSFKKQLDSIKLHLLRNGFPTDIIAKALADIAEEKDDDSEWIALKKHGEKVLRRQSRKYSGYELEMKIKENLYRQGFQMDLIQQFLEELQDVNE